MMQDLNKKKTITDENGNTYTEGQKVWFWLRGEVECGHISEICDDGTVMVANCFEEARLGVEELYDNEADAA